MTTPLHGSEGAAQMRSTVIDRPAKSSDTREFARSISVARNLELLNACVAEGHYTLDSLAASTGVNRAYVDRVLKGVAPLRSQFEVTLPPALLTDYRKRQAEDCGLLVVEPLYGLAAQKAFVAGALGLMASLPAKASVMAKAGIPVQAAVASA